MNKKNSIKGFTLIELMVVMAIIALLAAILLPQLGSIMERGNVSKMMGLYDSVRTATSSYKNDTGQWPYDDTADGAYWVLIENRANLSDWQGPYMERPPTRSDGRIVNPWQGRMMLYDTNDGYGNDPVNLNGGPSPDRHLILENVPQIARDMFQNAFDGRDDGDSGKVSEFNGDWVSIVFSEGS